MDTANGSREYPGRNDEVIDKNFVVVNNPVSTTEPGAAVRIDLATHASHKLEGNEEIVVDFSGPSSDTHFILPESIKSSHVRIRSANTFSPADVLVQGQRVILTIPTIPTIPEDNAVEAGDFIISFSQVAGIKNPLVAGHRIITVSSFLPHYEPDEVTAVIRRTTTIDPDEGPRGSEFTLEGKGYQKGTVTIFEDKNNDRTIDAGETLTSVKTEKGAFSAMLTARGEYGEPAYMVSTRDSNGETASVSFTILPSIELEPGTANLGSFLRMTIHDWPVNDYREVAAVTISGVEVILPDDIEEFDNCFDYAYQNRDLPRPSRGTVSLDIKVPTGVPPGDQLVSVYNQDHFDHKRKDGSEVSGPERGACADLEDTERKEGIGNTDVKVTLRPGATPMATAIIEIVTENLVLSPTIAARGQKLTIAGSGFTRASGGEPDISEIWIGTHPLPGHSGLEVGTNGVFVATVNVPLDISDGEVEVRVVGHDNTVAQAFLDIPEPTLTLEPDRSGRGSEVSIGGTGFIAGRAVRIHYGDGVNLEFGDQIVGVATADARGRITSAFTVPYSATNGGIHTVTAVALADDSEVPFPIKAEVDHTAVDASVSTLPATAFHGDYVTVRGENFPAFTLVSRVEIGGVGVAPRTETVTDKNGSFEAEVLVPQLELGNQVLTVQVGREIAIHVFEIVAPPLSGPPSEVFKMLIRHDALGRIWHLDSSTQRWSFFDPSPELSEFSTLTHVQSGDILFVQLLQPRVFQGDELVSGWSHIALK